MGVKGRGYPKASEKMKGLNTPKGGGAKQGKGLEDPRGRVRQQHGAEKKKTNPRRTQGQGQKGEKFPG